MALFFVVFIVMFFVHFYFFRKNENVIISLEVRRIIQWVVNKYYLLEERNMKKIIFCLVAVGLLLGFGSLPANAQETQVKDVFSIPEPTWIYQAGIKKGRHHDRQDLGMILNENTVLKVRQVNPNFKEHLSVRLLGNDSQVEKVVTVGAEWTQISAASALVPFVDTPYGNVSAQLEYEVADAKAFKPLPTYRYQTNAKEFFDRWDQSDGSYALVQGKDFQLLIPKVDKEQVRNLKDYASLDELIENYTEIFAYYNQVAGFDGSAPENQNGQNRYFIKADIHGSGGAYYGDNWTASSSNNVAMWLKKVDWGTLHEIAHGYQAGFDGVGLYTGEVSNNLFATQYQYNKYGKEADKIGWLFNLGKKEEVERQLYEKMITNNGTYNDTNAADVREKLILLTMLKQKAGDSSFTKMYQGYRKLASQPNFDKKNYPLPDLLNKYYSENSQQDFTPMLEKWGIALNPTQPDRNRFAGYPAVASLAYVVPENELLRARNMLDDSILINSNFEMVQNQELAPLNLKGDLTIQLKTEEIQNLVGMKVTLKDGKQEVSSQIINSDQLIFKDVPNGVYSVSFVGNDVTKYSQDNFYVYVKEAQNNATISLKKINISNLVNQTIQLLGVGEKHFGTFRTDLNNQEAIFSITSKDPHSYFNGKLYSKIVIKDSHEVTKYEKSIEGSNAVVGIDKIPLKEGDIIEIYHAETKNRLYSPENIIDKNQKTNRWVVTKRGLQNQTLQNDPFQDLLKRIDTKGMLLLSESEYAEIPLAESADKKQFLIAIQQLDEPYKTEYMNKFSALFK